MINQLLLEKEKKDRANILQLIVNMNIYKIDNFARTYAKVLMNLYDERVINDPAIEQALSRNLRDHSRNEFRYLTDTNNFITELHFKDPHANYHYPTHEYLVFGINKGMFNDYDLSRIPLDKFNSLEEYINHYTDSDLLDKLRVRLLNPPISKIILPGHHFFDEPLVDY